MWNIIVFVIFRLTNILLYAIINSQQSQTIRIASATLKNIFVEFSFRNIYYHYALDIKGVLL